MVAVLFLFLFSSFARGLMAFSVSAWQLRTHRSFAAPSRIGSNCSILDARFQVKQNAERALGDLGKSWKKKSLNFGNLK